ncbi:TIGR02587 family membrane protein [Agrobacterium larrymoorei]|uniref:Integral membrane protein (TIGR02587 family) n=1 Tax=Agrobacterium larrymoorei TaxID=160699 RepID=A0ABU0UEU5_9HYPH|nr:TIGR02587 family membrane protein [Agrobacterium larrymoorei]MDQ1183463.1 putative integral membrane protein (TIGR02587 family) [Agrobacterium larrymoorei]
MAESATQNSSKETEFLTGLARGVGGALLFALPMFMTMEMWFLGFYMSHEKLLLLCVLNIPLLVVLAKRVGFEKTSSWFEAIRDAVTAYGLAIIVSAAILALFGVINDQVTTSTTVAKIAIQAVPASIGALLGRSQLGMHSEDDDEEDDDAETETSYFIELFMMLVGALFLALNVAPTEEMILIAYKITPYQTLITVLLSLTLMHGFVYALHFKGGHGRSEDSAWWHTFIRFTIPGYVIALGISLYCLWSFERLTGTSLSEFAAAVVILGFPAAIGAASARLVL